MALWSPSRCVLIAKTKMSLRAVSPLFLFGFVIFFQCIVSPVEGGECCRAHYTESESQEAVWCSDYCCFDTQPYCCNDRAKRAGEGNRSSFCRQWFSAPENVWAPILIAIAIIFVLTGCGLCCCCCRGPCCVKDEDRKRLMKKYAI